MSPVYFKSKHGFGELLEDHSEEGISILTSEPSWLTKTTILIIFSLVVTGVIWSFFGQADVIVQAPGTVNPESELHRVYSSAKGELVDIYITEGMPVVKGDVLARIDSVGAVEMANRARTAKMKLEEAQLKFKQYPEKVKAMEKMADAMLAKIEGEQKTLEKLQSESIAKLSEEQTLKLRKVRTKLEKARGERAHALENLEQHKRLFETPGQGGISLQKIEDKRKEYRDKSLDYKLAEAELGEFEVSLSKDYTKKEEAIERKTVEILTLQGRYDGMLLRLRDPAQKAMSELKQAQAQARAAARISNDDIDEDIYLLIRAPVDGIITKVNFTQVGDKVNEKTPLASIAPKGVRKILEVQINERDRAFLKEGMQVKIKVNAFPYQRYGFLRGELEHVAPATSYDSQSKKYFYKGRVGLYKDYYTTDKVRTPIRYGMKAKAEIVVRKRRLIDLALDPFRNVSG